MSALGDGRAYRIGAVDTTHRASEPQRDPVSQGLREPSGTRAGHMRETGSKSLDRLSDACGEGEKKLKWGFVF